MDPVTVGGEMSPKLVWLLKDVLPALVGDCRAAEAQHHELAEQVNRLQERKVALGEHLEALGGAIGDLCKLVRAHGGTEEQLAHVVGKNLAATTFAEVPY